ncbi:hypothetical protein OIU77_026552 [Salix suchowensis]|uniref:Uncharacterized protein n=1 Tax=Salix suchowensis TaxID=1278906 RepID=A0ABQ9BPA2_9ROSI|nr:hypothetical protein OIU77_026552 [Salix suchowensis]
MSLSPTLRHTLSSVYHKPPETFVTRVKATAQKTEDDEYAEGSEAGYPESSAQFCCLWFCFRICPAGPPSSLLQVAVKNNQQPVWYFNDKISLHVFFTEDGRMERGSFLEVKGKKA